jgi:hypothetical protein
MKLLIVIVLALMVFNGCSASLSNEKLVETNLPRWQTSNSLDLDLMKNPRYLMYREKTQDMAPDSVPQFLTELFLHWDDSTNAQR